MNREMGTNIKIARQNKNMTQDELAERLAITSQAISKWERNISLPDVGMLEEICRVLEISADFLLGIEEQETSEKLDLSIGKRIQMYRTRKKMSLEDMAMQLNVTSAQAAAWEECADAPDTSMVEPLCSVLGITEDALFGKVRSVYKEQNESILNSINNSMVAEPLVLIFSSDITPIVCDGLETDFVEKTRYSILFRKGVLIPTIRLMDDAELAENNYQILIYGKVVKNGTINKNESDSYQKMILDVVAVCEENYADVLNKSMVKTMVDNLKEKYPGVADDLVPERISYLQLLRHLQDRLRKGESIYDLIHILEELEEIYS